MKKKTIFIALITLLLITTSLNSVAAKANIDTYLRINRKNVLKNCVIGSEESEFNSGGIIKSGTIKIEFSEDKSSVTITLKDLVEEAPNEENFNTIQLINASMPVKIILEGTNKISAASTNCLIVCSGDLEIAGSGTLLVENLAEENSGSISSLNGDVIFNLTKGGRVEAKIKKDSILALKNKKEDLAPGEEPKTYPSMAIMTIKTKLIDALEGTGESTSGYNEFADIVKSVYGTSTKERHSIILKDNNVVTTPKDNDELLVDIDYGLISEDFPSLTITYFINAIADEDNKTKPATDVVVEYQEAIKETEYKDESCEAVIGPNWTWDNELGVCKEKTGYRIVNTATK